MTAIHFFLILLAVPAVAIIGLFVKNKLKEQRIKIEKEEERFRVEPNWWAVPVKAGIFLTIWGAYYGTKPDQTWFCGGREWGPSGPFNTEAEAKTEARRIGKIVNGPTAKKLTGC